MKTRERIYIVPHWAGLIFGGTVFSLFVFGYFAHGFSGASQALVISFVVAGIVVLIQTNDNLRGIRLRSCHSQPVVAGSEQVFEVTFANDSDRDRMGLRVRYRQGWSLHGDARIPVLKSGRTVTVRIHMPVDGRGRFANPTFWVSSTLPAGLCFSWKVFEQTGHYHVYPRPSGQPLAMSSAGEGGAGDQLQGGFEDVGGHRAYSEGDLLSHLDWKVFAKNRRLVVKTFEDHVSHRAMLCWEDTSSIGDPEVRLEQMSYWISECVRSGRPFEMKLGSLHGFLNEKNLAACRIALASFVVPA